MDLYYMHRPWIAQITGSCLSILISPGLEAQRK